VGLSTLAVATADIARYHFVSKAEKRIVIYGKRRVFDGFFKIDEVELSYERFDGKMSPPVKRLCFERGDSLTLSNPTGASALILKDTPRTIIESSHRLGGIRRALRAAPRVLILS